VASNTALFAMGSLEAYEVGKPIGKGQFSMVYKARSRSDGIMMALKKVAMAKMEEKEQEKCLKEVRLLEKLQHTSIIKYFEAFIEEDELIIVCEWASGGDLRRVVKKANEQDPPKMFTEVDIWSMFEQIVSGVKYMHQQRIMHRDIKPANVLIMGDGKLKLADLGLGRFFSDQTMQAYSKVGTPVYMSPEVLHGKGYDLKSDVWSLGCLLYELATLRTPFKSQGDNLYAIFKKINDCTYQKLPEGGFSAELRKVVDSILRTDPATRPHTDDVYAMCQRMVAKNKANSSAAAGAPAAAPEPPAPVAEGAKVVEWIKLLSVAHPVPACPAVQLPRHYFAVKEADPRGGKHRFEMFCATIEWLIQIGQLVLPKPITGVEGGEAATSIIAALQANNIKAEYTLPRLKQGFGDQVCDVLLCIVEAATANIGWRFGVPQRVNEEDLDSQGGEDDADIEAQYLLGVTNEVEEDDDQSSLLFSSGESAQLPSGKAPIESGIDPIKWREEAKKVLPNLAGWAADNNKRPQWNTLMPELRKLRGSTESSTQAIRGVMLPMADSTNDSLEAIQKQENSLRDKLQGPVSVYQAAMVQYDQSKEKYEELTVVVESCATSLAEVAEQLDTVKDTISDHSGAIDDTSVVVKMKQGLTQIKRETKELELQLGVTQSRLGAMKKRAMQSHSNEMAGGGPKSLNHQTHNTSLSGDDDYND